MEKHTMSTLDELAQKLRREYFREWRAKNRDKVKRHNDNYWTRKAKQQAEGGKK